MANVFYNRELSGLYVHAPVVSESSAIMTSDGILRLKVGVHFGGYGATYRNKSINMNTNNFLEVTKALKEHENSILDLIGMLEEAQAWCVARYERGVLEDDQPSHILNLVLPEESPLMVHCVHRGRAVVFNLYGEGLIDMHLNLDCRSSGKRQLFVNRMNELVDVFRNHLNDIDSIKIPELMKGLVK